MAVNRTKVLEAAQKFLSKGQYDKAIAEYQKLVTEDPRDVRTLLKIGDLHTRRNKPKDAIDVYQKVAELYAKQGFFLKAVAVYKQILKLDATHIDSSQKLAKMYEELALTSDALSTYEQVADAYVAQNQMAKALETMQRMVDLDPQNIAVRIKFAEALSKADKPREAAKAFAEGAHLLKEQGRMDDYLRVVERQLYHDADNLDIARELSSLYLERSDPKRALAKLQVCFKADPRDVQTLEMLAEAFRQLGQIPKTISVLKEIARLHAEVGAQEPRRRTLKRILDLDPNDAEARQGLGSTAAAPTAPAQTRPGPANANARPSTAQPSLAQPPAPQRPSVAQPPPDDFDQVPDPDDIELEVDAQDEDDDVLMMPSDPPPAAKPAPRPAPAPAAQAQSRAQPAPSRAEPAAARPAEAPRAPQPTGRQQPATETREPRPNRINRLLEEADKQEGAGRYEAAESLLKQILDLEDDHLPTHERLKDLYLATDRRVDAVRELLWLSEAWSPKNRERAAQYAKAAYDLAPNAAATKNRLRALGVDPDQEPQEEVMFVDDSRATALEARDDTGDASLDAILPPMSEPPGPRLDPSVERPAAPPSRLERLTRSTVDRPGAAQEDPLDIPLSPDDFDAEPPHPASPTLTKSMISALLEQPITPEEFEREPEPVAARAPRPAPAAKAPAKSAQDELDDVAALLDAPISPDEFDAPPPRRDMEARPNMGALLDQPLPPDDFGLSDERFERSGLIDVEEPNARPSGPPRAASTVPPGRGMRAELLGRLEDEAPSIEFAEINTGEVDLDASLDEGEGEDATGSTVIEDGLPLLGVRRPSGDFRELGTGEIVTIQSDVPPRPAKPELPAPPAARALGPAIPPPPALKLDLKQPPLPAAPPIAFKAPAPAPAPVQSHDETDFSDLDFDAAPEPTVRGEPIPELVRQSIPTRDIEVETPAAFPTMPEPARAAPVVLPVFEAVPEPQPREDPTQTLGLPVSHYEQTEEVVFHADEPAEAPASGTTATDEALPPELEEVLDEADFFSSQGMHDEALEAIQEAILIYPKYQVLKDRLAEYEAKADAKEEQEEKAAEAQDDDSFDIAQQLATELAEPSGDGAGPDEMVDVESVFAQFKKGVAQQISLDDSDTHFDLGIAYKEMGLIDDAVQEFETAARSPSRACTALTMIGMCSLEKGDVGRAVEHFERALSSKQKSAAEELALHYELGNAYELLGQLDRAVANFEKVVARDRTFRGVSTRLDQLKKRGIKSAGAIG